MKATLGRWSRVATLVLLTAAFGGGCALLPPQAHTKTTVVLLPDDDGKVGAVSLSTVLGTRVVDSAFGYTTASGVFSKPSAVGVMSRAALQRAHGPLLKAQPPPTIFVLHFVLDTSELMETSRAGLPALLAAVRERKPKHIAVFGHADASGSDERNWALSQERADITAQWLRSSDPSLGEIDVQFFGNTKPLSGTGPGAQGPRNRRVEILIF